MVSIRPMRILSNSRAYCQIRRKLGGADQGRAERRRYENAIITGLATGLPLTHPPAVAAKDTKTTVVFYVANGNEEGVIKLVNKPDDKGLVGNVDFEGNLPVLGGFKLQVTTGPKTNRPPELGAPEAWAERPLSRTMYVSVQLSSEYVWRAKGKNHSTVSPSLTLTNQLS